MGKLLWAIIGAQLAALAYALQPAWAGLRQAARAFVAGWV